VSRIETNSDGTFPTRRERRAACVALVEVGEADYGTATADPWLNHEQAADHLGISKSTLYQYASQEKIECRKLGGRLEYLRSTLDRFKDQQIRPARRLVRGSIIPTALGSGK